MHPDNDVPDHGQHISHGHNPRLQLAAPDCHSQDSSSATIESCNGDTPGLRTGSSCDGHLCSSLQSSPRPSSTSSSYSMMIASRDHAEHLLVQVGDDTSVSRTAISPLQAVEEHDYLRKARGTHDEALQTPRNSQAALGSLPNELLFHILSFLDVCDLLSITRVNRLLRRLSLTPLLHRYRLQRNRLVLPPLLSSPGRPSLADLISRSIFLTKTSVVSRRLARSLVSIRLARRLAARPSVEALVDRAVLPKECVPGMAPVYVAPALAAKRKAIEKERTKDSLRRWVGAHWKGQVRQREEGVKKIEEMRGIGRVWRLRRFWERVSRGDLVV